MKYDLSMTISAIIAVVAVISPIFTAIINNSHQRKMKKIELAQLQYERDILHRKEIFEDYLRKAGNHIGTECASVETSKEYNNAYLLALLYAPISLRHEMMSVNDFVKQDDSESAIFEFEKLIPEIQEYIWQLKIQ